MSEDVLSDAFFDARERDLKKRLKPKRFEHARGVSKTAASLAETYGVDVRKARLAGLLHDWDKEYGDDEIRERARAPVSYTHLTTRSCAAIASSSRALRSSPSLNCKEGMKWHIKKVSVLPVTAAIPTQNDWA